MDVHIKPISVETMKKRYTEALVDLQCAKDRIAELERELALAERIDKNFEVLGKQYTDQARAEERERCAKHLEQLFVVDDDSWRTVQNCAEAIRALGDE